MTIGFDNREVIASVLDCVFSEVMRDERLIGLASKESEMRKLMFVEWAKYWINKQTKNNVMERIP